MCIPLFYLQRLCGAIRLTFDITVIYSLPRLSLSYPVELSVHVGQTVTTNATLSGHASTWFHKSGFYTKGKIHFELCNTARLCIFLHACFKVYLISESTHFTPPSIVIPGVTENYFDEVWDVFHEIRSMIHPSLKGLHPKFWLAYPPELISRGGRILTFHKLTWMYHWIGSHFHDWIFHSRRF